ncbi:hypothetical protein FOA52_002961 [Chlamydomonas sp. UWO 241]|nr:hypothetical protein FOA52_002961 [Chlamydomonas sp. UWO 241]
MASLLSRRSGIAAPRAARPCVVANVTASSPKVAAGWSPTSWRKFPIVQQPKYDDKVEYQAVLDELSSFPPLVFAGECRNLKAKLAKASIGEAFIVQGGDCAEAFSQFNANKIRDFYRVMLQMGLIVAFGGGMPVIKLGSMGAWRGVAARGGSLTSTPEGGVTF